MKKNSQSWTILISALTMGLLILDARTALSGAKEGIDLCIRTVIPSLFPFLFLSNLLSSSLLGHKISILRPVGELCGIPSGGESILLLGLVGGYPVGARSVADAYHTGQLSKSTARRLLGFCNNAGPAFIFGMLSAVFTSVAAPWLLWLIHIMSALLAGALLPEKNQCTCNIPKSSPLSVPQALERAIRSMASICGWVVVFRVLLTICKRWFLWLLPRELQIVFIGILELSNGCCELNRLSNEGLRFILSACLLAFGGACVGMQTISVTGDLGTGMYFYGKLLQGFFSFILSILTQHILFQGSDRAAIAPAVMISAVLGTGLLIALPLLRKKVVAFPFRMMYNNKKC